MSKIINFLLNVEEFKGTLERVQQESPTSLRFTYDAGEGDSRVFVVSSANQTAKNISSMPEEAMSHLPVRVITDSRYKVIFGQVAGETIVDRRSGFQKLVIG